MHCASPWNKFKQWNFQVCVRTLQITMFYFILKCFTFNTSKMCVFTLICCLVFRTLMVDLYVVLYLFNHLYCIASLKITPHFYPNLMKYSHSYNNYMTSYAVVSYFILRKAWMVAVTNAPLNRCAHTKGVRSLESRWVRLMRKIVTAMKSKIHSSVIKVEPLDFSYNRFQFHCCPCVKIE
jgi:hypothetical protein